MKDVSKILMKIFLQKISEIITGKLKTDLNDANFSFSQFILKINELLDIHSPFKYII